MLTCSAFRLWSIKPELDVAEAQQTYSRHQRSIQDVALLANNLIASTDGVLHVSGAFVLALNTL